MRDMRLGAEWDTPNTFPLHIRRNVTIKGSLEAESFASLDFRYLTGKLLLEAGVWLSIFRLRLRGLTASHAPSFPFVATSPGSHVLFQDCLLHRISCVPMELVYESIRAPALTTAAAAGSGSDAAGAAGARGAAAAAAAVSPSPQSLAPPQPTFASDIELLQRYCFTTVAGGRECRPTALWLRDYAYEARLRRSAGVLGTGGFVLHARNTTLVCDYPVSEECMRENGPEFCVTRELSRRQRQEHWRRGAVRAALAAAGTAAALAVGWWLLRRQVTAAGAARPAAGVDGVGKAALRAAAVGNGAVTAAAGVPTLQWLAEVSARAEAEAEAAAAAAGIPCRRPLVRMPSAQSGSSWPVDADVSCARGSGTPPNLSRTSTRNMEQGPGTGTGPSSGPGAGLSAHTAPPGGPDQPQLQLQLHSYPPSQARERAGGAVWPAGAEGFNAGLCPSHLGSGPAGGFPLAGAPFPEPGRGPGQRQGQGQEAASPEQMLDYLGQLFGACEVVSTSGVDSGSSHSSVLKAAAETQERILHFRQTINGTGGAAAIGGGGGGGGDGSGADVYDHLEVTELLGAGTFGKVFKGFWHGTLVAVKLMVFPAALTGLGQLERMAAMEAAISSSLSHPNIVQTYTWRVTPLLGATALQPAAEAPLDHRADGPGQQQQQQPGTPASTSPREESQQQLQPFESLKTDDPKPRRQERERDQAQTKAPGSASASPPRDQHLSADVPSGRQPGPGGAATTAGGQIIASAGVLQEGFELCLILELCDAGSLRDLLAGGGFRQPAAGGDHDHPGGHPVRLGELLDVATDVARAMAYLHAKNIVHADLKSRNVLLKSVSGNPAAVGRRCGVVAKVSDFGLSLRIDNDATHVSNMYQGTAAFMAPELLLYGRVSKASDVYSFGILMWEMYTCGEAFKTVPKALLAAKVIEGLRPDFPPEVPPPYLRLAQQCWAEQPGDRPSFEQVVRVLNRMRAALHGEPPPPPPQALGSVTAQLRRNTSRPRGQHLQQQPLVMALLSQAPQLQQAQAQKSHKAPPSTLPNSPPLETILSTCESLDGEVAAAAASGGGGASRAQRPLPLLTEALLASQRRAADVAWANMTVAATDADADASDGPNGRAGGRDVDGAGCAVGAGAGELLSAPGLGVGDGGAAAAGSSGAFGVLQLQRLIENNLLVVGGCDGGSTVVTGLN